MRVGIVVVVVVVWIYSKELRKKKLFYIMCIDFFRVGIVREIIEV